MPRSGPRDAAATRRALLDTAGKLFAEHGVNSVSVRAINSAAGLGAASTHHHFGSKDALLEALLIDRGREVLHHIRTLATDLAGVDAQPTAREIVELLAAPYRDYVRRDPERAIQYLNICGQLSLAGDQRLMVVEDDTAEILHGLLRRAYPDANAQDVIAAWLLTVNVLLTMAARWAAPDTTSLFDAKFDTVTAFVTAGLHSLLAGPKPIPEP